MKSVFNFSVMLAAIVSGGVGMALPSAGDGIVKPDAPISFRKDLAPLLETNCGMCHQDSGAMGGLSLLTTRARDMLVDVPSGEAEMMRVKPGDPEHSYLIRKLEGTHVAAGGRGLAMPISQAPFTKEEMNRLREWIKHGAPDN